MATDRRILDDVFDQLVALAGVQASGSGPLLCCDLVRQEALYDVQERLAGLLLLLAQRLKRGRELVQKFPSCYVQSEKELD